MDGKKKAKGPSESEQHHRIKRLLQDLETEFFNLLSENQNCNFLINNFKSVTFA